MSGVHGRARRAAGVAVLAVGRVILGAVLILAAFAAMLWADFGPQDWVVLWLVAMFAVVAGVTLAWTALYPPEGDSDG